MRTEFEHGISALVESLSGLSSQERGEILGRVREEDARHSAAFVDIPTDDEEQSVGIDIAKGVTAKWLEERGK